MFASRLALTAFLGGSALPSLAQSAATPAAPEPEYTLSTNIGLFSDYRFRGISQTNKNPAIQGGFDLSLKNGFYLGNWNSNVDSAFYNGANIEMDFYGGYKATIGDFGLDVGGLYYYYPGSGANGTHKIDNFELYVGGSWGPLTAKYSYSTTDFFGVPDSKGSWYLTGGAAHDFGNGFGLNASIGYQKLAGNAAATEMNGSVVDNILDWKIGGTYTVQGFALGLSYIATNRDLASPSGKNISSGTVVASVSKSF